MYKKYLFSSSIYFSVPNVLPTCLLPMIILHQQPKAATDGMFTQPSPVYRSSAISLLRLLIILYLYFVRVFVVCVTDGNFDGLRGIFGKVDTVIVVVFAVLALVGAGGDERALFALNQPHTVQVNAVQTQRKGQTVVCDLPHAAHDGMQIVKHFQGDAGGISGFLRGGCIVLFCECHNNNSPLLSVSLCSMWNSLLCGVCCNGAQQINNGVLLLFDGLQMGNCVGLVCLNLCHFIHKILEKIRQLFENLLQLVIDVLHMFTPSEHPADKELQPGRSCTFRIKRGRGFREDIRNVVIVCLQINIQVYKRPLPKCVRVIRGGERESLPCCFNQRGAGQGLLCCQILHRVRQLPGRVEHQPDNVPCNIFPKLNL
nr:MAG TPA: hypothetical protein [Caudoviricetes sp.]